MQLKIKNTLFELLGYSVPKHDDGKHLDSYFISIIIANNKFLIWVCILIERELTIDGDHSCALVLGES